MKLVNQTTGQDLDPNNVQLRSVMLVWTSPVIVWCFWCHRCFAWYTRLHLFIYAVTPPLHYFAKFQSTHKMKKIIIIIHGVYIVLFSALKQTHCAHVTCDTDLVTVSFYSAYY